MVVIGSSQNFGLLLLTFMTFETWILNSQREKRKEKKDKESYFGIKFSLFTAEVKANCGNDCDKNHDRTDNVNNIHD